MNNDDGVLILEQLEEEGKFGEIHDDLQNQVIIERF